MIFRTYKHIRANRAIARQYRQLQALRGNTEGIAYLEFALTVPFLLALLLGSIEVTRYVLIVQKLEKISSTISDVVSQGKTISTAQLDNILEAAREIMLPYEFETDGYVIITSVKQNGTYSGANPPKVQWQYKGGGQWTQYSDIGSPGTNASLPGGLTLYDKDNVIVTEVFYQYTPLFLSAHILENNELYKVSVFKPRLGELSQLSAISSWWDMLKGAWS